MAYRITAPKEIRGTIRLPASKSISNRALILQALCAGRIEINNLSEAADTGILKDLLDSDDELLDCGHSGTAMRFLTAYLATLEGSRVLTGSDRMRERPIGGLADALVHLGADITYLGKKGYPPLRINGGTLRGGEISMDASVSSQFVSALLLIAPQLPGGLTIHLKSQAVSRPYIDMTLSILRHFGINVSENADSIRVEQGQLSSGSLEVEPDWSGASYWYAIAALAGEAEIGLPGLKKPSWQGDAIVAELFTLLGVKTTYTGRGVLLSKTPVYARQLGYNFIHCPDLSQTLMTTTAALGVPTRFSGLETLHIKETDRVDALKSELKKFGVEIEELKEGEITCFPPVLHGADLPIRTFDDHRMAMAFAPLSSVAGSVVVENPEVVEKSYPGYWRDLESVGFSVEVV